MSKAFPKQEEKLVNDNGDLKWLQRTIYMPGDTGMVVISPTHMTEMRYGGARVANSPIGIVPVGNTVDLKRRSNTPTETGGYWVPAQYNGDPEKTIQKGRYLWSLPDVRQLSNGGYLNKFDMGGTVAQPESNKQKRMKELLLIINGAAKELSTKQPGDNVAYLAQVMQDPQEAELLEAIVAEIPDAQEIIDQVSQLASQMFKCGGKTKKKVKKGAKGCIPCKKLMRVGGKLVNVWSDCEGNIISKHQAGGWLIPKGGMGLITNRLLNEKYRKEAEGTGTDGQFHYYLNDDNQWVGQKWNGTNWEKIADLDQATLQANALNWARGTKNAAGQFENPVNDFFVNGFIWDYDKGTGAFLGDDREALARTTLGDLLYNQGTILGKEIRGVKGRSQNNWTSADPVEALDPTADDYIDQFGVLGAFRRERDRFRDGLRTIRQEKRAAVQGARDTRKDNSAENDVLGSTVRNTWRNTALAGMRQNRADQMAALIDATFNKWGTYYGNRAYKAGSGRVYNTPEGFDNRVIANAGFSKSLDNRFDNTIIANNGSNYEGNARPNENGSVLVSDDVKSNSTPRRKDIRLQNKLAKKENKQLDQEMPSNAGERTTLTTAFNNIDRDVRQWWSKRYPKLNFAEYMKSIAKKEEGGWLTKFN